MSEKKLRCESWCKDCKAFDWGYCTEKYFKDENVVLPQPDVIKSVGECKVCGKPFDNNEDLYSHYDNEHNKQTVL